MNSEADYQANTDTAGYCTKAKQNTIIPSLLWEFSCEMFEIFWRDTLGKSHQWTRLHLLYCLSLPGWIFPEIRQHFPPDSNDFTKAWRIDQQTLNLENITASCDDTRTRYLYHKHVPVPWFWYWHVWYSTYSWIILQLKMWKFVVDPCVHARLFLTPPFLFLFLSLSLPLSPSLPPYSRICLHIYRCRQKKDRQVFPGCYTWHFHTFPL